MTDIIHSIKNMYKQSLRCGRQGYIFSCAFSKHFKNSSNHLIQNENIL